MKRSEAGKMPCERKIVVLHYFSLIFRGEKSSEQWELEVQYLTRYKTGVNLLYQKIGEIRSACYRADGSEFNGN